MKYLHAKAMEDSTRAVCGRDLTRVRRATMNEQRATCVDCVKIIKARKRRTGR